MMELIISKEQAKEFAYECFDAIIRDIQAMQDEENNGEEMNREIAQWEVVKLCLTLPNRN